MKTSKLITIDVEIAKILENKLNVSGFINKLLLDEFTIPRAVLIEEIEELKIANKKIMDHRDSLIKNE